MNSKPTAGSTAPRSTVSQWMATSPHLFTDDLAPPHGVAPDPRRKPQFPALTTQAHVWLTSLPPRYQPLATAMRHPHIINRLCLIWDVPAELGAHFDELMLSNRPGREGFVFEVLSELADLLELAHQGGKL